MGDYNRRDLKHKYLKKKTKEKYKKRDKKNIEKGE